MGRMDHNSFYYVGWNWFCIVDLLLIFSLSESLNLFAHCIFNLSAFLYIFVSRGILY